MTPRPEVTKIVRNQSSRNGIKPKLIVLHSTESKNVPGLSDLQAIGNWFDNSKAQASAHTCNDAEGNDARYVPDERKAWSCAGYNSVSLNHEQVGAAVQKMWPDKQLNNTAEWVSYWSKKYGIPIQRGKVNNGVVVKSGVVMHSELGPFGGGHHDPGPGYPIDLVLQKARALGNAVVKPASFKSEIDQQRAAMRSLLALRGKLRQRKLEKSVAYKGTDEQLDGLRKTIGDLK
jgi:N-acetyl-anhydromuramyl-L-alanine amidase AmpD